MPENRSISHTRKDLAFEVAGECLSLLPCGALWWEDAEVLVVSDLHLEKASSYAARGQLLPPYDTGATLRRITALIENLAPATVISLGDSFHDRRARPRMAASDVTTIRTMTDQTDWIWIEGNHDPKPPEDLGGRIAHELVLGALIFRHEPTPGAARGEIAGHLHPCARVAGRGRSVRSRCFASDGERMVMPAYGALTGGLNVLDAAFDALFPKGMIAGVLGRDGVYATAGNRLIADTLRAAG
ncbi:MAG: ligase-associated DNA damage response endonuclease PdeM [Hyphomonadaceae bacterium]|nr:ligase-associated DNA damage response endonuclease PdeM [Hyphomonadaceae bacterium]